MNSYKLYLHLKARKMRHKYPFLVLCSVSISICLMLYGCKPSSKEKLDSTKVDNITLINVGLADSATDQNKGYGIAQYIYSDFKSDSIWIYSKVLIEDSVYHFKRFYKVGLSPFAINSKESPLVKSLVKTTITSIVKVPSPLLLKRKKLWKEHQRHIRYLIKINPDTTLKYYSYSKWNIPEKFENSVNYLLSLADTNGMDSTNAPFNEDSVLVPILNQFPYLHPAPPLNRPFPDL